MEVIFWIGIGLIIGLAIVAVLWHFSIASIVEIPKINKPIVVITKMDRKFAYGRYGDMGFIIRLHWSGFGPSEYVNTHFSEVYDAITGEEFGSHSSEGNKIRDCLTLYVLTNNADLDALNKIRSINVEELNYGFIVTVGCHRFAIETGKKVSEMIGEYLKNPKEIEKKWFANEFKLKRNR